MVQDKATVTMAD